MSTRTYAEKRDFGKTPEPEAQETNQNPWESVFVVQEHHASHLHYDFRLSIDGVLKSWAVPKGVPTEPKVRRLAVETEDHPLAYADFEGDIPEGEYGAGKVIIWDKGSFELLERTEKKIVVALHGTKMKGDFALVRFAGKEKDNRNWLIMKVS
ncbi:MAG: 3'-phosphoesterase [Methanomassiliicoccales archaeon]|nr:3'-phosphoesterase [Methanomassiliicoccales archaeon]